MRLDIYLSKQFLYTRNQTQSFIRSGLVRVNTITITKPSHLIKESDRVEIREDEMTTWVARSAGKLAGFLRTIEITVYGKIWLDIWSSTGGFCQILLNNWAKSITAVDVGTDQLHPSLRADARIDLHEQTDIRDFWSEVAYDLISIDVSFISLREILRVVPRFCHGETDILALWKPQFEVGSWQLTRSGVPKNSTVIASEMYKFEGWLAHSWYTIRRVEKSEVIGEAGNQEYMYWLRWSRV